MYPKKGIIDENRLVKAIQAKEFFMRFYNAADEIKADYVYMTEPRKETDNGC